MTCNQCGANMPDSQAFCSNCGAVLSAKMPVTVEVKKSALPVMLTFALSMILLVASILSPFTTAFYDIPAFSIILGDEMDDFEEEWEDISDDWEESRDDYDLLMKDLTSEEEECMENFLEKADKMMEKPSVMNVNATMRAVKALEGIDRVESLVEGMEEPAENMQVLTSAIWVISVIVFLPSVILALLAGLKKKVGLTIPAMILTALAQMILSGWVLLVLSLAVNITQIVLQKKYAAA